MGKVLRRRFLPRTTVLPLSPEVPARGIDGKGSAEIFVIPTRERSEAGGICSLRGAPPSSLRLLHRQSPAPREAEGAGTLISTQILSIGKNRPIEPKSLTTIEI
jgi:hypothetical protein